MTLDIEVTLNRWGFGRVVPRKWQIGPLRFTYWPTTSLSKHAVSFEINWKPQRRRVAPNNRLVNARFHEDS